MPGSNANSANNSNAKRLNRTLKSRFNKRTPNITRALRVNRAPPLTHTNGKRNLFAKDRAAAGKLMGDLFQQGFEDRQRMLNAAKYTYGYNEHMLKMLESHLNRVGVYE
jgi:hypothetical protein